MSATGKSTGLSGGRSSGNKQSGFSSSKSTTGSSTSFVQLRVSSLIETFRIFNQGRAVSVIFSLAFLAYLTQSITVPIGQAHPSGTFESGDGILTWIFALVRTLGLSFVPLEAVRVIIPIIGILEVSLFGMAYFVWRNRAQEKFYIRRMRAVFQGACITCFALLLPGTYILSGFFTCDYSNMTLLRPNSSAMKCWEFTNQFSGIFGVVSAIAIVLQIVFAGFNMVLTFESNPLNLNLISTEDPTIVVIDILVMSIHNVMFELLPFVRSSPFNSTTLGWIPFVTLMVSQLAMLFSIVRSIPFFKSFSNSVFASAIVTRFVVSLGMLVARYTDLALWFDNSTSSVLSWALYGGFSGGILVLAIITFALTFGICLGLQQLVKNRVRGAIKKFNDQLQAVQKHEEQQAQQHSFEVRSTAASEDNQDTDDQQKRLKAIEHNLQADRPRFSLYILENAARLLLGTNMPLHEKTILMQDLFEIGRRNQNDSSKIINLDVINQLHVVKMPAYAMLLLQRSLKVDSGLQNGLLGIIRQAELERLFAEQTLDDRVSRLLKALNYKKLGLESLTMQFFKALMNENDSNRAVAKDLDVLAASISSVQASTSLLWEEILLRFPNNGQVLRAYATFMDDIMNDQDSSAALQIQADDADAARLKRNTRNNAGFSGNAKAPGSSLIGALKHNKVYPLSDKAETTSSQGRKAAYLVNRSRSSGKNLVESSRSVPPLDNHASGHDASANEFHDMADATNEDFEEQEQSKNQAFRDAITERESKLGFMIFAGIVMVVSLASLSGMYGFGVGLIRLITAPTVLFDTCNAAVSSMEIMRNIRFAQLHNTFGFATGEDARLLTFYTYKMFQRSINTLSSFLEKDADQLRIDSFWTDIRPGLARYPQRYMNFSNPSQNLYSTYDASLYDLVRMFSMSGKFILGDMAVNLGLNSTSQEIDKNRLNVTTYDLLKSIRGANIAINNNDLYQSKDYLMLWFNQDLLQRNLENACVSTTANFQTTANVALPSMIGAYSAIAVGRALFGLVFFIMTAVIIRERGRIINAMQRGIAKEVKAQVFQRIETLLMRDSKHNNDIVHKLERFKIKSQVPAGCALLIVYVVVLVIEASMLIVCIVSLISARQTELNKTMVLHHSDRLRMQLSKTALLAPEYFYNSDKRLFEQLGTNLTYANIKESVITLLQAAAADRRIMRYGDGGSSGLADSTIDLIQQILMVGTCKSKNDISIMVSHPIGETPVYDGCEEDLFFLSEEYGSIMSTAMINYNSIENRFSGPLNDPMLQNLKVNMMQTYTLANQNLELLAYVNELYSGSLQGTDYFHGVMTAVYAVEFVVSFILGVSMLILFQRLLQRNYWLRQVLRHVPLDSIESNKALRSYVYNHTMPVFSSMKTVNKNRNKARTLTVMAAALDGVVFFSPKGHILELNQSALQLFEYDSPQDIIGKNVKQLFEPSFMQQVDQSLHQILGTLHVRLGSGSSPRQHEVSSASSGHSAEADTAPLLGGQQKHEDGKSKKSKLQHLNSNGSTSLELMCVRKDGVAFHARAAFSLGEFDSKPVVTVFIRDITIEKKSQELLAAEKKNSEQLLLNVLPAHVAQRLKKGETNIAEKYDDVTVLFSDLAGFTAMSSTLTSNDLIVMLNTIMSAFDALSLQLGIEKIKTIGDAFFAVGGLDDRSRKTHAQSVVRLGVEMLRALAKYNILQRPANIKPLNMRIGVHTGPISAGVIGTVKYMYDCFGDTVNVAATMESTGVAGRVQVSRDTYERVFDLFTFKERTGIEVKGKGAVTTYIVDMDLKDMEKEFELQSTPVQPAGSLN